MVDTEKFYTTVKNTFYDDQVKSGNPLRRWLHGNRYRIIRSLVKGFYCPGKIIADFGSASCCWNTDALPVIGVDLNENSLIYGKNQGRLTDFRVADISNSGLADNSCDIIVSTETLEHMADIDLVLSEMYRILKPGGVIVLSVPHDTPFSLWKIFFSLQVLYKSYFCGSAYYKKQCGHIQHFSPKTLRSKVETNGFKIGTDFSFFNFHLFITAYKQYLPLEKSCKDLTLIIPLNNEEDKLKLVLNNLISQYIGDILSGFFGVNTEFWHKKAEKNAHCFLNGDKVLFDFIKLCDSNVNLGIGYHNLA